MNKKILLSSALLVLLFSGCTQRLGNFTLASTNNVSGLNSQVTKELRASGKSCVHLIFGFPFGEFTNRIQSAMDDAIDNGHKKNLNGDVLVNVKIENTVWSAVVYGQNCLTVDGDLISLKKAMSKPLVSSSK